MSAHVHPFPAPVPAVLPPANPAFKVTFEPSATPQFTFTNMDDSPVGNYLWVDDATGNTEIFVTLEGDLQFNTDAGPIVWTVKPDNVEPPTVISTTQISFSVPSPAHYFSPWMFRLILNTGTVMGIRTPNIYLSRPLGSGIFTLEYLAGTGGFLFHGDDSDTAQAAIDLDNELVLVNVAPAEIEIDLTSDEEGVEVAFQDTPVQWSSTNVGWAVVTPPTPQQPNKMSLSIPDGASGQSSSLQFAITVTVGGETVQVLSPDPIIINATIGDG